VPTTRHLALLGGRRDTPATAPDAYMIATLIGGANLDLSTSTIPPTGVTITKFSLIGGLSVRVPHNCPVEISGLTLIGRKRIHTTSPADGPLIRIRAFGGFGGIRVEN
jgi:hypothetical protein